MSSPSRGKLFGVGLGPGDPELMTVKARRIIDQADVVAYPTARHGRSIARSIAAPFLRADHVEIAMTFPVTTEGVPPGGYDQALREFYDEQAALLASHLDAGRTVAVLCEGDPFFYGSYMYLHERLAHRYTTKVVPGVTSFSASAAAAGVPLARGDDVLTILSGTLRPEVLAHHLRTADAAVVLKLGRTFDDVREAAQRAEVSDRAIYVERASTPDERSLPLGDVDGEVPYMSLVLVPAATKRATSRRRDLRAEVAVVGLGPAGPEWLTAEAQTAIAEADDLVGYVAYVDRVPPRAGQDRHESDNRAEADRARLALKLAASGRRVAVLSSGDPGIFAMAAAVLEVLEESGDEFSEVRVRVVPGVSAMQAAAARVGAPLGHDFCVISLSDQLKPWEVIERRLDAAGASDLVVAIYNPASRTRRDQLERARTVLLAYRSPLTPVVVARDVGGSREQITVSTLADFDEDSVDMRTLVIVGSSTTRVIGGPEGVQRVYTPRSYPR